MSAEDFSKFVASQQKASDEPDIDWKTVRDEWLRDLDLLYQRVVDYLAEYIGAGSISFAFTKVVLTEENIGRYFTKRMEIKIGRQLVHLEPIGTLLIGSKGRVDAVGSAGRAQIILVNERAKSPADLVKVTVSFGGAPPPAPHKPMQPTSWAWKIVTNSSPRKFVDIDKKSFLELLMEVANA